MAYTSSEVKNRWNAQHYKFATFRLPKELGEELIIDIEKYKVHPDGKQLYCFVYDPDGFLGNPNAIKNDLETSHRYFVKIFIRPEI